MNYYFTLQYRRICRFLIHFGVHPWLGFMLVILAFSALIGLVFSRSSYPELITLLLLISCLWPLSDVSRNNFLIRLYPISNSKIRLIENGIVILPFTIAFIITSSWIAIGASTLIAVCFAFYNKANVLGVVIPTPFTKAPFEFIVGFRMYLVVIIGLYILAGIGCVVNNYNLSVVSLAETNLLCMLFYRIIEPVSYVKMYHYDPKRYIHTKCKIALQHSFLISFILLIGVLVVYPAMWHFTIVIWLYTIACVIMMLLLKYALFPNNPRLQDIILVVLGVLCPPILLALLVYYYRKSIDNLSLYLS